MNTSKIQFATVLKCKSHANRPPLPLKTELLFSEWRYPSQSGCNANALPNHSRSSRRKYTFYKTVLYETSHYSSWKNWKKCFKTAEFAKISHSPIGNTQSCRNNSPAAEYQQGWASPSFAHLLPTRTRPGACKIFMTRFRTADGRSRAGSQSHRSRGTLQAPQAALGTSSSDSHHHPHFFYF